MFKERVTGQLVCLQQFRTGRGDFFVRIFVPNRPCHIIDFSPFLKNKCHVSNWSIQHTNLVRNPIVTFYFCFMNFYCNENSEENWILRFEINNRENCIAGNNQFHDICPLTYDKLRNYWLALFDHWLWSRGHNLSHICKKLCYYLWAPMAVGPRFLTS